METTRRRTNTDPNSKKETDPDRPVSGKSMRLNETSIRMEPPRIMGAEHPMVLWRRTQIKR